MTVAACLITLFCALFLECFFVVVEISFLTKGIVLKSEVEYVLLQGMFCTVKHGGEGPALLKHLLPPDLLPSLECLATKSTVLSQEAPSLSGNPFFSHSGPSPSPSQAAPLSS